MSVRKKRHNATGRRDYSRFVLLDFSLLETEAYRSLSCGARALLVEFHRLFNGANNGELFMAQRTAAEMLGVATHSTAGKYIAELIDRGFVRMKIKGSFSNKTRLASTFILTNQRYNDQPPTRDFRRWKSPQTDNVRAQKLPATGRKKQPTTPLEWPEGGDLSACSGILPAVDGENNCSTYNIPPGREYQGSVRQQYSG